MMFQAFCEQAEKRESKRSRQSVKTNNTFVISFSADGGTSFSIDPIDIVNFLEFLQERHDECIYVIESHDRFTKKSYLNYEEKTYRALYKYCSEKRDLNTISSLGGSQTKGITKVISKFIAYIAGIDYPGVDNNTLLDPQSITKALKQAPKKLSELKSEKSDRKPKSKNKELFIQWLRASGLSDRSIKSYANTAINIADQILSKQGILEHSLYDKLPRKIILSAVDSLNQNTLWQEKNETGNSMYQAGVNKYAEFITLHTPEEDCIIQIPKPFLLLAGISGTGKSRFVRQQAEAHNPAVLSDNFCLVPVRPDWHEPSDLLGYVSRINKPTYIATKVLAFIIKAWRAIAPDASSAGCGILDLDAPAYWLCLDEMNLAPVEQYFADYLSVLETRQFNDDSYLCEPLLDINALQQAGDLELQKDLGLSDSDNLWQYFENAGIGIPPNLIVAGTVNMDETTHGFSRKVIDRALTLDYGTFFPNDYDLFFEGQPVNKVFTYTAMTTIQREQLTDTTDADGSKTIGFLKSINEILKQTPFELAYRALNELLLHVVCFNPQDAVALQAVWDDFLMTKVLPRIDGDDDKLRVMINGESCNLLEKLEDASQALLTDIWDGAVRPDLFREKEAAKDPTLLIECRSRSKLKWMKERLESNTFTSYWP